MRKMFVSFAFITAALVLSVALPTAAANSNYFTDAESASIDVSFELTEIDVAPPPAQAEANGTYTVIIPSSLNLKHEQDFILQAEGVSLASGKYLAVYIDGLRTFAPDGELYLYNGGTDANRQIKCHVFRGEPQNSIADAERITGPNDTLLAVFRDGDVLPRTYGKLFIQPGYSSQNISGTYTGIVYFKIDIEND